MEVNLQILMDQYTELEQQMICLALILQKDRQRLQAMIEDKNQNIPDNQRNLMIGVSNQQEKLINQNTNDNFNDEELQIMKVCPVCQKIMQNSKQMKSHYLTFHLVNAEIIF